jgi:hypothetical protein
MGSSFPLLLFVKSLKIMQKYSWKKISYVGLAIFGEFWYILVAFQNLVTLAMLVMMESESWSVFFTFLCKADFFKSVHDRKIRKMVGKFIRIIYNPLCISYIS